MVVICGIVMSVFSGIDDFFGIGGNGLIITIIFLIKIIGRVCDDLIDVIVHKVLRVKGGDSIDRVRFSFGYDNIVDEISKRESC